MRRLWLFSLLALALAAMMPSSDSLWIDEFETYAHVTQPDLASWWQELTTSHFSEVFMPFGMLSAWAAARVLGTSEYALRAVNLLWIGLSIWAMALCGRSWKRPLLPLFLAVQPFVWGYANEARPYALQIACASWIAAALVQIAQGAPLRGWPLHTLAVASLILLGTSLFGVLTVAPAFVLLAWCLWKRRENVGRAAWVWLAALFLGGGTLGLYYLHHLSRGAAGAQIWSPGLSNFLYFIYEFGGFQGLGLPRDELRELARNQSATLIVQGMGWHLGGMLLLALLLAWMVFGLARRRQTLECSPSLSLLLPIAAWATLLTFTASFVAHFPCWGRHLAPVFPFYLLILFLGAEEMWQSIASARWRVAAIAGSLSLLLTSSSFLRWSPSHHKDDYRTAAQVATKAAAAGGTVWWCAAPHAALYYPLPLSAEPRVPGQVVDVASFTQERLRALPAPDVIIYSKPDIFDRDQLVAGYLQREWYQPVQHLKAITVFQIRQGTPEKTQPLQDSAAQANQDNGGATP